MKKPTPQAGKTDAKVLGLGALLLVALGGVFVSYRLTNAPRSPVMRTAAAGGVAQPALEDMDRLLAAVENRIRSDGTAVQTDWAEPVVPAAPAARAPLAAASEAAVLKLRGVVRGGAQPMAFINETTVGLGEVVEGYKLTEIREDGVTLVDGQGRQHVLPLYE